jgi:hypothetical protein
MHPSERLCKRDELETPVGADEKLGLFFVTLGNTTKRCALVLRLLEILPLSFIFGDVM